jgi:NADPH-dependent ferric siderophore reductase
MSDMTGSARVRREPPRFRRVEVRRLEAVTPRLTRVTFGGDELEGMAVDEPAASVRLLVPAPGEELTLPVWNGNEFLNADGSRPIIRTFTPRRFDAERLELDLEIVVHERGAASDWARGATPGSPAAISGTGRGYAVDPAVRSYLLAGDETAMPAIAQLLESFDPGVSVDVIVEIAEPDARLRFPDHPRCAVEWVVREGGPGDALVEAVAGAALGEETRVWAAGEATAVQRIRRHLFEERGLSRRHATVRGYWKHGRGGDEAEED